MVHVAQRARFLRGDFSAKHLPLRPPWSVDESRFVDTCTRCGDCLRVCEEKILVRGQGGFPEVSFSRGECTFCGGCASACKAESFEYRDDASSAWTLRARVTESCLAHQGVVCVVCAEQCDSEAIRFAPRAGRIAAPQIISELCNGCGACYRPCPAKAIAISHHSNEQHQHANLEVSE